MHDYWYQVSIENWGKKISATSPLKAAMLGHAAFVLAREDGALQYNYATTVKVLDLDSGSHKESRFIFSNPVEIN